MEISVREKQEQTTDDCLMPCPSPANESSLCKVELAKNRKLNALCSTFSLRDQSGNFLNLELFSAIKMLYLMAQGHCEHQALLSPSN